MRNNLKQFDLAIVGGGIIGCATAMLAKRMLPASTRVVLIEKENTVGFHQSGRNSGVVHMGLYYKPNSLKARLCQEGAFETFAYCDSQKIPYKKCGKLVVAINQSELGRLENLFQNSINNGVPDVRILENKQEIQRVEPNCEGISAIYSPYTAIVDWKVVTESFRQSFLKMGGEMMLNFELIELRQSPQSSQIFPIVLKSKKGQSIRSRYVLTCCGLFSDRVAKLSGSSLEPKIVPIRGEYLGLPQRVARGLLSTNIYPVPDPKFPFLGVHFTPRMDGSLWLGPNAVFASHREGYSYFDISLRDTLELIAYPGFRKLSSRYIMKGLDELTSSVFSRRQIRILQKYVPKLPASEVYRVSAGVRAQALTIDGKLVDDFVFDSGVSSEAEGCRILHVRNAPSPGATSSLAIAKYLLDKMQKSFLNLT
ncbi:L-2-hydroxyglutarate dehydrogenase, mitochondrial-like [Symsagittifera roscoffensis]|uniref:L-2-hydroxyglutarate dehydrogenase, mitochondrial-like n=1 Tax=Symsagittifera roscoffensis TaxID=84072 RepID=UPI00307C932D